MKTTTPAAPVAGKKSRTLLYVGITSLLAILFFESCPSLSLAALAICAAVTAEQKGGAQ